MVKTNKSGRHLTALPPFGRHPSNRYTFLCYKASPFFDRLAADLQLGNYPPVLLSQMENQTVISVSLLRQKLTDIFQSNGSTPQLTSIVEARDPPKQHRSYARSRIHKTLRGDGSNSTFELKQRWMAAGVYTFGRGRHDRNLLSIGKETVKAAIKRTQDMERVDLTRDGFRPLNFHNEPNIHDRKIYAEVWKNRLTHGVMKHGTFPCEPYDSDEKKETSEREVTEEEEETDVPEEIESVIKNLIRGLKDKDTVVRWSSAKGIGRITSRLPKEFADEVVGSFMDIFNIGEGDEAWHGACLALAELAKRGLLLPSRLESVIPLVINALQYDERRDAACYVCWAFGRAYSPQVMREYVAKLSNALMVVMVYDREVNCRRAAAAAFQENVGRQGSFPHGIEIITTADFFTVAVRNDSYRKISPVIAEFEEYGKSLIDHLAIVKINHWDRSLRELSAETIGLLTEKEPGYIVEKVEHESNEQTRFSIIELVPSVEKDRLYRGKGGEITRHGICQLIEAIATAKIPLVRADPKTFAEIVTPKKSAMDLIDRYVKTLLTEENVATRGMSLALGSQV
ncbi:tubulin folding cofactor D [Planoprotostelium fungivorum]|uniref:Tubulin folding cofactor D n=1 Tax=Planoprotostelium fungivorum TaxID=1890364 RepID=A0A2P6NP33_9EUKA|nr:tubulin folding cofactor D [Planoprotostelium fungivorum]